MCKIFVDRSGDFRMIGARMNNVIISDAPQTSDNRGAESRRGLFWFLMPNVQVSHPHGKND